MRKWVNRAFPMQVVEATRDSVDCNIYFFDAKVETGTMYLILISTILVLICGYIVLNLLAGKNRRKHRKG